MSGPDGAVVDRAFEHCARLASGHYENFPVASLFIPAAQRAYVQAVYAFARGADDFADEGDLAPAERLEKLDDWERRLELAYAGRADHPVFVALAETVRRTGVPKQLLADLVSAFRQDVVKRRYEDIPDLLDYCARSANPVGRIVLHLFGHADEDLARLSDDICTGLQLANFWQDVGVDLAKDRLYIPRGEMARYGYAESAWRRGVVNGPFRELMSSLVGWTRGLFRRGAPLPSAVERDLGVELRLVWLGGMTILQRVEKSGFDVYGSRALLRGRDKAAILIRALLMRDIARFGLRPVRGRA